MKLQVFFNLTKLQSTFSIIKLPTLKVGDFTINESLAACLYFEDQYKSQGTCLIPQESKSKAHVLQKAFEALNLQKYCNENIVYYLWKTASNEIDQAYLSGKKKELNKEFERWETYLNEQNSSFIATNDFTLADAFFYPQLALAVRMGYPLQDKYKKLSWLFFIIKIYLVISFKLFLYLKKMIIMNL